MINPPHPKLNDYLTVINRRQVNDVLCLCDELIDSVFYTERLVQLACDGTQRPVGCFVCSSFEVEVKLAC